MGFFDDAISTIGRGLAQTAVKEASDATGFDIGGTLNFLFGDNQATGGANINNLVNELQPHNFPAGTLSADQFAYLQNSLDQQTGMLTNIGAQLNTISQSINSIFVQNARIQGLLQKIQQEQIYIEWSLLDSQITTNYIVPVTTAYSRYTYYVQNYPSYQSEEVKNFLSSLASDFNGAAPVVTGISTLIQDNNAAKGVLQLWSTMMCGFVQSGELDYRDAVNQYMNYYKQLVFAQLSATNLLMEAYSFSENDKNPVNPDIAKAFADYKTALQNQESVFIQWLIPIVYAGATSNSIGTFWNQTVVGALQNMNPDYISLPNCEAYYTPSVIFDAAETLLASLYCTDDIDRRIVVYMEYFGLTQYQQLLQSREIILKSTNMENPVTIKPQITQTLDFPGFFPGQQPVYKDYNWNVMNGSINGVSFNRYVFFQNNEYTDALPDGSYTVTTPDLANMPVLNSPSAYYFNSVTAQALAGFMTSGATNYVLSVSGTSNSDFMNFLAYNYSSPMC